MLSRDVVEVLLRNDALTNVADSKGCYPLHLAAWKGDAQIVRLLIHQGPSHTRVNEQVGRETVLRLIQSPDMHSSGYSSSFSRHDPLNRSSGEIVFWRMICLFCFCFSR